MGILTSLMGWGSPVLKVKISMDNSGGVVEWDVSEKAKPQETNYKISLVAMYVAKMISNLGNSKEFLLLDKLVETLQILEKGNLEKRKILDVGQLLAGSIPNPQSVFSAELYEKSGGTLNIQTHATIKYIDPFTPISVYLLWQDLMNSLPENQLRTLLAGITGVVVFYKSNPNWGLMDLMRATQHGLMSAAQQMAKDEKAE